ncbi:hypothetical protein L596_017638 [Steinernema carpocapsae]|uniref:Uncharacterized protein n=1 Tax=Steinernema carpocapsae TaxID=34508 RepID=A0A4U5N2P1_STECR|nr:hypothetical protein L596_017638 [Steinernema carpocapsae]
MFTKLTILVLLVACIAGASIVHKVHNEIAIEAIPAVAVPVVHDVESNKLFAIIEKIGMGNVKKGCELGGCVRFG